MKLTRLQKIFEELQFSQNEQGGFGNATPYSLIIEEMLKDSTPDFCLAIAEKSISIGRKKAGLSDRPEPIIGKTPMAKARNLTIYGVTSG